MFTCIQCGATFANDIKKSWGKTQESSGLGQRPVCTQLVPDETLKDAKGNHPLQICRGDLVPGADIADAKPSVELHAISVQ